MRILIAITRNARWPPLGEIGGWRPLAAFVARIGQTRRAVAGDREVPAAEIVSVDVGQNNSQTRSPAGLAARVDPGSKGIDTVINRPMKGAWTLRTPEPRMQILVTLVGLAVLAAAGWMGWRWRARAAGKSPAGSNASGRGSGPGRS